LVVVAESVGYQYPGNDVIRDFSTTILRQDRVGIIGPNGCGKTTLLRILLGELEPQQGQIRMGTGIRVAYFDQLRAQLDVDGTLKDNLADGNDMIVVGGASRHIMGYLQDFLFPPERILSPVSSLSGGERNRLLLAKLFILPSNVLVLDEPTNDLDAETLELLEERLLDYGGTILMVSHDRAFLNNVATSTIAFEGAGRLWEYVGGYDDWLRQRAEQEEPAKAAPAEPKQKKERAPKEKRKLSYKEARELQELPLQIEALEAEKERLLETLNSPEFYVNRNAGEIRDASDRLQALEEELDVAYGRWDELESLSARLGGETG
jgi:ATP-binding cassette subfamily F protein uup